MPVPTSASRGKAKINAGVVNGAPDPVAVCCTAGIIVPTESRVAAQYRGLFSKC